MIGFATIGTSVITASFLEALALNRDCIFVGAYSRSPQNAHRVTAEHGGSTPFTSLEQILGDPRVDAVYIASPNALHHGQALRCIAAGKHVLIEKPVCSNEREAREVFEAARRAGAVALEAMRPLHDPAFWRMADALDDIGRIRRACLRFGKYSSRCEELKAGRRTNIFDCGLSTGALMDIGIYTVEPALALFGTPDRAACEAVYFDEALWPLTGGKLDGAGTILAGWPHMSATLEYSKITNDLQPCQFEGDAGTAIVDSIATPTSMRLELREGAAVDSAGYSRAKTSTKKVELDAGANTMEHEIADFCQAVIASGNAMDYMEIPAGPRRTLAQYQQISIEALALIDAMRAQTDIVFAADERNL